MRIALLAVLIAWIACLVAGCEKLSLDSKPATPPIEVAKAPQYSPESDPARPEYEKALDLIQGINWSDDQHVRAMQFVEQMKQSYPDSPYPLIAEAQMEHRMWGWRGGGAPEHIRILINRSFSKSRAIADAYVTLAKLDLDQGQERNAADNAAKAFKLSPDKPEVRYVMARVAERRKSYDEAEQHYRKYLEVSQKPIRQSNIYYTMAEMFGWATTPQLDKADEAYQSALKLDPSAPWKIYGYARYLLYQRGDYEGALFYIQQAMQIMQHPSYQEMGAFALYAKWADGYASKGTHYKARTEQRVAPQKVTVADLEKIAKGTGVSVDKAFVELAAGPALGFAVQALLKAKVVKNIDVKTEGECGCTALIKAADANNFELAKYLIANKANVNGTNASSETALSRFIIQKNWGAVNYLLDHGARVNFIDKDGFTPLHLVHVYADADINGFKLLLERKADPTVPLHSGYTLLSQAVMLRRADLVGLFVKYGADPNEQMPFAPRRPLVPLLSLAASYGLQDIVLVLLNAGADPWTIDEGAFKTLVKTSPDMFKIINDARAAHPRPAGPNSNPAVGRSVPAEASAKQ